MSLPLLSSFRRQQLVLDFSSLKDGCPEGLYLSLTPGNPSLWVAAFFVRKGIHPVFTTTWADVETDLDLKPQGPYEGAIVRFQLLFPVTYPDKPPLITFSSDVFHPLVVPLTTYTFSTNFADASHTVSASDEDRLPPGAFTLRYAFPKWFSSLRPSNDDGMTAGVTAPGAARPSTPSGAATEIGNNAELSQPDQASCDRRRLILNVLRHIQDAFESEALLDTIPLDTVGDPSAWHAWRAYRGLGHHQSESRSADPDKSQAASSSPKNPGEWKWDGVWESRVRNSVAASMSEAALFGNTNSGVRAGSITMESTALEPRQRLLAAADRQFRFSKLSEERFAELKEQMPISDTALSAS